jgi:hypothetical protein
MISNPQPQVQIRRTHAQEDTETSILRQIIWTGHRLF